MELSFEENNPTSNQEKSANQKLDLDTKNLKFFKEDIFYVPYDKLGDSSSYKHFKHVFIDEDDYEDFKQDLVNFHQLRSRWKEDRKKVSKGRSRLNSLADCSELSQFNISHAENCQKNSESSGVKGTSFGNSQNDLGFPAVDVSTLNEFSKYSAPDDFLEFEKELPIMEFFQNDEHFQEFDRVFETFKSKRRYASNSSLDKYRWSPHPDDDANTSTYDDSNVPEDEADTDVFEDLKIDDIFADFFDNDDDFKSFEEEFENFKLKRRSRTLEKLKHRNSVCDLIDDLKAFCDTEEKESSATNTGLQVENKLSLPKLWNKGNQMGEWDYIYNKIKQQGKLSSVSSDNGTGRSDLMVTCDSDSGNYLLDDLCESNRDSSYLTDSNRDTGYYSEARYNGDYCNKDSCTCASRQNDDCQFTCHHKCLSHIQLDCKFLSHDPQEDEGAVLLGETTLSDLNNSLQSTELSSEPASEKDETDSGYRSGTIPDESLPHKPSQATLNREELKCRISEFNKRLPGANFALREDDTNKEAFQGFIKVTLNLVRPISMSLGARPPSIYEVLTKEHIVEQNTQNISFYMPRDTVRSIHAHSSQPTKEVVALLLKKFHILDHPRKFAMYEQELKNNKIARLRRVKDHECPLAICLQWELENVHNHRLVLQENETGEIDWDAFCVPELNNFMRVLDREEQEYQDQLKYKYKVMKQIILRRMKELRLEQERQKRASMAAAANKITS